MKKFLRIALLIGGSLLLGIGLGVMLVLTDTDASPIAIFAVLFLSIWLATVLHEGGHLVAGLLTGQDYLSALGGKALGDACLISRTSLRAEGDLFLCGMSRSDLSEKLGVPVIPVENDGAAFLSALLGEE